ncbi:MAG TPA: zinc ribbon domain-containing protein [Gemmatimonadaceae bacterium]|nr:zinc ribbon domain-containing protein [Gemmatimonadaceae bacterium]
MRKSRAAMVRNRAQRSALRTDQAKTLKCPECGTPNYPTEWYCERCGGELATM